MLALLMKSVPMRFKVKTPIRIQYPCLGLADIGWWLSLFLHCVLHQRWFTIERLLGCSYHPFELDALIDSELNLAAFF